MDAYTIGEQIILFAACFSATVILLCMIGSRMTQNNDSGE